jgi:hypothetical protein
VHFAALQVLKVDSNPIEWPVSDSAATPNTNSRAT